MNPLSSLVGVIGATLSLVTASPALSVSLSPVTVKQGHISVLVEGSGPDIVLIPGLASSYEVWADLASRLRQTHRLHLVQVAGFAGSPAVSDPDRKVAAPTAEAIAEYIRSQRLEPPDIIGHSLGGEVALMLGARHPDQRLLRGRAARLGGARALRRRGSSLRPARCRGLPPRLRRRRPRDHRNAVEPDAHSH